MENLENRKYITLTNDEYSYLKELCNSMYKTLEKLPKKMRTPKFYVLEGMIKNIFNK